MKAQHQLQALARIARLKADLELAQFSALRAQLAALDTRAGDLRTEMTQIAEGAVRVWANDNAPAPIGGIGVEGTAGAGLPTRSGAEPDHDAALGIANAGLATPLAPAVQGHGATDPALPAPAARHQLRDPARPDADAGRPPVAPDHRLQQTRLANTLTRAAMLERQAVEAERARLTPEFEAARATALRAFGRAEAVGALGRQLATAKRIAADRRSGG